MSGDLDKITTHYSEGGLLAMIEAGLRSMDVSPDSVTIDHLGAVDEFHILGRPATRSLCERLEISAASEMIDIGCGIGGTARFVSSAFGCRVTGLDLTPEYIDVARTLTDWTGHSDLATFTTGSALDAPFPDDNFDCALLLHVGMNIADKSALFRETHRLLRPGGRFGVYDVMRQSAADIAYPVPWASDDTMSFDDEPATYRRALEGAGFVIDGERSRGDDAIAFFTEQRKRTSGAGGPPPLGLHVLMGQEAPTKIGNMIEAVSARTIAPVEIICHKPGA